MTDADLSTTICAAGWTATVRPPVSYTERIKHLEAADGGAVAYRGTPYTVHGFHLADPDVRRYELDHLIPLELGGSPADPRNLWMEPYEIPKGAASPGSGSQTKDEVENATRAAVCRGALTLDAAQRGIASDWGALGRSLGVTAVAGSR